jgi:hypothetical protein
MNRFMTMAILAVFALGMTVLPGDGFAAEKKSNKNRTPQQSQQFPSQAWLFPTQGWLFPSQAWELQGGMGPSWSGPTPRGDQGGMTSQKRR